MGELIVHGIAPEAGALVLGATATLQTKPGPFGALHIFPAGARFEVERKVHATLWLVCGQVELGDNPGNDFVIKLRSHEEGKLFKTLPKVCCPLAHDIIRGDDLGSRVMQGAPHDDVVNIGVAEKEFIL